MSETIIDLHAIHQDTKQAALVLRAYNHPRRLRIMELIMRKGTITVTEIYKTLRMEQSVASQHLAILRGSGLVATEREGRFFHYRVVANRVLQLSQHSKILNSDTHHERRQHNKRKLAGKV